MDDNKKWYASKTVWAGLVGFAAGVAGLAGYVISEDEQAVIVEAGLAIVTAVSGLVAIYGRVSAARKIR